MFVLCHACANESESRSKRLSKEAAAISPNVLCNHTEEQREFVTTLSHLELNLALEKGYRVKHLYSTYEWTDWTTELFRPYVRKFMKVKAEASGWPDDVGEDPVLRQRYLNEYRLRYGIELEPDKIKKNAGLRYIAKL
jgi:hypothetical protein